FGEERFVTQLAQRLRNRPDPPYLAVRGADHSNKTTMAFVQAIHAQWAEFADCPRSLHRHPDIYLDRLLALFHNSPRPLVLILKRFHRVLDNLDKWVLGVLHQEEESRRLHTVTITPVPYEYLKKRWKAQDHFFSNSDYGNARHRLFIAKPSTYEQVLHLAESLDIPKWVADCAWRVTGGYPEPV